MISKRAFWVVTLLILYAMAAPFLPERVDRSFYTLSLLIKDLLVLLMPITVCFFIAGAILSFERKAPLFILTLLLFEGCSNLLSIWYAWGVSFLLPPLEPLSLGEALGKSLEPLWRLSFSAPKFWSADKGSMAGLLLGLLAVFIFPKVSFWISYCKNLLEQILTRFFSKLIPLFILGFVARMRAEGVARQLFIDYGFIVILLMVALVFYLLFLFLAGSGWSFRKMVVSARALLPAGAVAFSSGCSLSTMPWTISGTAQTLQNPNLAKAVIPATTNIQQIGDCITNAFLVLVIHRQFYGFFPELSDFVLFTLFFTLARFATAAVIGGAIFLMIPLYERYLHFTPEMVALILAFNVLLDPIVTASNVVANGALCRIFERFYTKITTAFQLVR